MNPRFLTILAAFLGATAIAIPVSAQTTVAPTKNQMAEQVFKNVQVLKGIPVDDFMQTMGIMSAALGMDCSECHVNAGTVKVDWAADTARKVIARKMVTMMADINKQNFGSHQLVTCWSCHRGRDRPLTTPTLEAVYGPGSEAMDDLLVQSPGQPSADAILDKYLRAIGGQEKLAAVKSFVGHGRSVGFGGFGGGGNVQLFAKFPDLRATFIDFPEDPQRGNSIRTFDGKDGWIQSPLTVLTEFQLAGGDLDGARMDALMSFPGQIKQVLTNLKVSLPATINDLPGPSSQTGEDKGTDAVGKDRLVNVVQGTGPRGLLVTLYFDQETGLLVRQVRYDKSPIGRAPTQVDYGDYRDVGGIKMPFRIMFAWLGGRDAIQLNDVQTNVPVEAAKFGRPTSAKAR